MTFLPSSPWNRTVSLKTQIRKLGSRNAGFFRITSLSDSSSMSVTALTRASTDRASSESKQCCSYARSLSVEKAHPGGKVQVWDMTPDCTWPALKNV